MSSPRYRAIVAMMDDPLNRACIDRELIRRGKAAQYLCPPVPKVGTDGCSFPTFRYVCRFGWPAPRDTIEDQDAEVFTDGSQWFATLIWDGDTEIGPFDAKTQAISEVQKFFRDQGFTILTWIPWDQEDTTECKLKA